MTSPRCTSSISPTSKLAPKEALASVDPIPSDGGRGERLGGVKAHLDTVTERAPIIAKYTGVLAAADIEVFTNTTTFQIMQSLRLDRGQLGPVHPDPHRTASAAPGARRGPGHCATVPTVPAHRARQPTSSAGWPCRRSRVPHSAQPLRLPL